MDGLAELGIDKGLIRNKKVFAELLQKEKIYHNEKVSENSDLKEVATSDSNKTA